MASVLLGFPGATVLAALNWHRMGRTGKAIVHLITVVIGTWALVLVDAGLTGLLVGIVVGYYLFSAQRRDQSAFTDAGGVRERNGLAGALIAIAGSLAIIYSVVLLGNAVGVGEVAHRGEVLFTNHAVTDVCAPTGLTTVFEQSDLIFDYAIFRETVKAGSRVVFEVEGPSGTHGPFPIESKPPFDCLGGSLTTGPIDPGTYVVRYRYDGQPGAPDLATGTFTVTAGPGSLESSPTP